MSTEDVAARALSLRAGVLLIDVQVQPRASRSGIVGLVADRLKVALTAPPVDGAANEALIELLARQLGVSRGRVCIERGQTGRKKTVAISGADEALLAALRAAVPR